MEISEAQRDVRSGFLRGSLGQMVSGCLWLFSAALGTWMNVRFAIVALVLGGVLIFPLTTLTLRILGRRGALAPGNPMGQLATQVAFTIPLAVLVVLAATARNVNWFY